MSSEFKNTLRRFIEDLDFFPYRDMDPLKIDNAFHTEENIILYYSGGSKSHIYMNFLRMYFGNEINVKVLKFYQKVVDYQITLGGSFNKEYITHLSAVISHFESKKLSANEAGIKKLKHMLFSLNHLLKPTDSALILEVDISTDMSVNKYERMSTICREAVETCKNDIWKSRLQLNALHFHFKAIVKEAESRPIPATVGLVVEDEKAPESKLEERKEDHSSSLIATLNQEVYKSLNIPTDTIANWNQQHSAKAPAANLDVEKFMTLVTQYCTEIKIKSQARWEEHLKQFTAYIDYRKTQAPFLFSNSEEDLAIRTAYYNLIKVQHHSLDDIKNKIQIIHDALLDPKLRTGFKNHRCLNYLALLKDDLLNAKHAYTYEDTYLKIANHSQNSLRL